MLLVFPSVSRATNWTAHGRFVANLIIYVTGSQEEKVEITSEYECSSPRGNLPRCHEWAAGSSVNVNPRTKWHLFHRPAVHSRLQSIFLSEGSIRQRSSNLGRRSNSSRRRCFSYLSLLNHIVWIIQRA